MRVCPECQTPVGEEWEHCLRCGSILPPTPEVTTSMGERISSWLDGLRSSVRRAPAAIPGYRLRRWAVPAAAIGVGAALALAGVAFANLSPTDPEIEAARAAQATAEAQLASVTAALEGAEASRKALIDDLDKAQARIAALDADAQRDEEALARLQERSAGLEEDLAASEEAALEQQDLVEAQAGEIAALTECLGGTQVALQFARDGLMGLADRAMEAVAVACFETRQGD